MSWNILKKNKKGDMAVLLFVVLVLVISAAALFSFVTSSNKVEAKISDARFIEELYSNEDLAEFYLKETGEQATIQTYNEFVEKGDYIESPNYNSEHQVGFDNLNVNLNENFKEDFTETFKTKFESYDFEEEYLKDLKEIVAMGNFEVLFDGEILTLSVESLELEKSLNEINVSYFPLVFLKFDLEKIGLHSFDEIYERKEACKGSGNVKTCFEDLENFEVEVVENGEIFVSLTSKKDFLIDREFRNVGFGFVSK